MTNQIREGRSMMTDRPRDTMASSSTTLAFVDDEEKKAEQDDGVSTPQRHDEENPAPIQSTSDKKGENEGEADLFLVKWDENDPKNPFNWTTRYKAWITFQLGMLALAASLGSSIISPGERAISEEFGVSQEVSVLAISLYVLGFAFGPCFWAPMSEIWGRRVSMLPAMVGLGLFSIGCAVSQNAQAIFITRFFSGFFGSAPVSNVSAALGDMYEPKARGVAVTFYAVAVVGGPTLGKYILAIWVFTIVAMAYFFFPEVYGPFLLKQKAIRLRKETGDERYHHPHEDIKIDFNSIVTKQLTRPVRMLLTEPMVTCIAIYASFVYSILYATLQVFPIVYQEHRKWGPVISTLPFLGLFVGVLCAVFINLAFQGYYTRKQAEADGKPVPEARLPPMSIGGFLFVTGLFLFGWTADPDRAPWPVSVVAAGFIGAGFNTIFQQCINFLVDTYRLYAASAVSANTLLRSCLAAGLPLAARPMFHGLGVGPAMSVLGGVAALALPVPFVFMRFGVRLRALSKFAKVD
ncbi:Pre-mRNA-splicing factor [Venturia inaequalis]|nr:Pre-mRNA-splicing factor [Venturia inaequalis]